jgi:hypothetical protein
MSHSIADYLPNRIERVVNVRADVNYSLWDQANKIRKARNLHWKEMIIAGLQKIVDDVPLPEKKKPQAELPFWVIPD